MYSSRTSFVWIDAVCSKARQVYNLWRDSFLFLDKLHSYLSCWMLKTFVNFIATMQRGDSYHGILKIIDDRSILRLERTLQP